jgi:hypothetical protein
VDAIPRLVDAWYSVLAEYHVRDTSLTNLCLQVVGRYVGTPRTHPRTRAAWVPRPGVGGGEYLRLNKHTHTRATRVGRCEPVGQ